VQKEKILEVNYYEDSCLFELKNENISYIMSILENQQLGHLYFGKQINCSGLLKQSLQHRERGVQSCVFEGDITFSLEDTPRVYPEYGTTDYRHPAYQIKNKDGNTISHLVYKSHKIFDGKPNLMGLPATYVRDDTEAKTLEITLEDTYLSLETILKFTIFRDYDAITRSVEFRNHGDELTILNAQSTCIDFSDADYVMYHLDGAWARERHITKRKLVHGMQSIESTYGASSAFHNPFLALAREEATEVQGEVFGFNLIYSGSFLASVEVNAFDLTRVCMGINPFDFAWQLEKEGSFQTPEVVMVYSDSGFNEMSHTYHSLYRNNLARGEWKDQTTPIYLNNWEATYFNFNEEKLVALAKEARALGIEMLVLDDGWFGNRNDDTTSLGDWYENKEKLPNGLHGLAKKINSLGLSFGLWVEPEMVNKDSKLYHEHPEWVIQVPGQHMSHGRNQYVLDLSNPEVVDYLYLQLVSILSSANITYIKWDMNRTMTEIGSSYLKKENQKEATHRYILGLYNLLERLTTRFPKVLFESCASGGNRFDGGMLYYMPQAWTSDNTDAVERLNVQYGTSFVYPLRSMASYISPSPNHQQGRSTNIRMRAEVAYFGTFGFGLDITKLSDEEKEIAKEVIEEAKRNRRLIQYGDFYRLESPFQSNYVSWLCTNQSKTEVILGYYKILSKANPGSRRIKLRGLMEDKEYLCEETNEIYSGNQLMYFGFILPMEEVKEGDFISHIYHFHEVSSISKAGKNI